MRSLISRLARDSAAQDMVEYALLVALVGFAGMAAWTVLQTNINTAYTNYDTRTQLLGSVTPDPLPPSP